jgi:hypothetical protein
MLRRILVYGILCSVIQVVLYASLLFLCRCYFLLALHDDYFDAFVISIAVALFAVIIIVQNILSSIINKKIFEFTLFGMVVIFFVWGWGEDYAYWPVPTTVSIAVSIFSLASYFVIKKALTLNRRNLAVIDNESII